MLMPQGQDDGIAHERRLMETSGEEERRGVEKTGIITPNLAATGVTTVSAPGSQRQPIPILITREGRQTTQP